LWERIRAASIQIVEGHTWDALAQAELALAKSGTVTVEAAVLGTPVVTFYRVNALSWYLQRWMVRVPFFSTVNLVAERRVVTELIQADMTAENIAVEGLRLLEDREASSRLRDELAQVVRMLATDRDPMETAADWVERAQRGETVDVR
jgi:lipid-A-disaccharide synthase